MRQLLNAVVGMCDPSPSSPPTKGQGTAQSPTLILARTILEAAHPVIQAASLRCSIAVDQQKAEVQHTAAQGYAAPHLEVLHSQPFVEECGVAALMCVMPLARPSDGPSWTHASGHSRADVDVRASAVCLIFRSTKWLKTKATCKQHGTSVG